MKIYTNINLSPRHHPAFCCFAYKPRNEWYYFLKFQYGIFWVDRYIDEWEIKLIPVRVELFPVSTNNINSL